MPSATIPTPAGDVPAYLARPDGSGPHPGVVVLHEVLGLTDDIRAWADRFADRGYLALAPDLFHWGPTVRCLLAAFRALNAGRGRAFAEIDAARRHLAGLPDCSGRVGVAGFCMGGGFALAMAPRGFAASAVNYGPLPGDPARALAGACPVVASYGGRDRMFRGAARRLEATFDELGVEHDVAEYPEASHSFLNHHDGAFGTIVDRVTGIGYVSSAAEDASRRLFAFFARHLAGPDGPLGTSSPPGGAR